MTTVKGAGSNVISTPKGGGAISGMGEKFSPDLFTGTGNFSVPIALPQGRNGFQPELSLQYSTGHANSEFGLGWSLAIPGVSRKTSKGIPLYKDSRFDTGAGDVFILSGAEDLIPVQSDRQDAQQYRPRTEGLFARIERVLDAENDYWRVRSKDGLVSWYGTPQARASDSRRFGDPAACVNPAYRTAAFEWKLSRTEDLFGNRIDYTYTREPLTAKDGHRWDKLYPEEIRYGYYPHSQQQIPMVRVRFVYEERPDPFSSYQAGFEIRTTRRCRKIEIYTNPLSGELLTKTYHLIYLDDRVQAGEMAASVLPLNGVSLLSQVSIEGHDGTATERMPPLEFSYSRFEPLKRDFSPLQGSDLPASGVGNNDVELISLFGNGLPDFVQMGTDGFSAVARYWRNRGDGSFDPPRTMKEAPAGVSISDPEVSFMDANGDGKPDLVVNKPGLSGYFPLRQDGQWSHRSFHSYERTPSFSLADPEVKLLDLDGDGITDVLRNGASFECFFNDPEQGFYKVATVDKTQLKGFPRLSFADPRVRTASLSGNGLQDMVLVGDGRIDYWPNLGHARWGERISMKNSPRLPYNHDPARVYLADVDGDGYSDLIYIENNSLTLWINRSGNAWSEPIRIQGTPPVFNPAMVRLADMTGSGVPGIVWSYDYDGSGRDRFFYFDFTGGVKPYLLQEMDNHMGALTRVEYSSSIRYYLKDKGAWQTTLPFPVLVVARVEVLDALSGGKLTTEYDYSHGYWDGVEREFRGFGRVVQRDSETFDRYNSEGLHTNTLFDKDYSLPVRAAFEQVQGIHYSPPVETRTWFHLGPVEKSGSESGSDWQEADFSGEYWQEDRNILHRPGEMNVLLASLPRRARRDALRTLRGSVLRSEVYALDHSSRQHRPYTVSENLQGLRLEYAPGRGVVRSASYDPDANNKAGSGYIFFSYGLASRTSQWERGSEPLTQIGFTDAYDAYGFSAIQLSMAIPRGVDPRKPKAGSEAILCTFSREARVHKDTPYQYLCGRVIEAAGWEVLHTQGKGIYQLHEEIIRALQDDRPSDLLYRLLSHSLTYYDGTAFTGLAYGELGNYGVPVRSETLVFTEAILGEAYGLRRPVYLNDGTAFVWPEEYPEDFQEALPANAGYRYRTGGRHYTGYYAETERKSFDFQQTGEGSYGLLLAMKDPLDAQVEIGYDAYKLLPVRVTDPLGLEIQAAYNYRVMQAETITDPNQNRGMFAFSPLGFLIKTAVTGKEGEHKGDTLAVPGTRMEYDFFAYSERKEPVFVKTIQREHHYHDSVNDNTLVSVEYSDGFGRLLQTRTQAEEVLFGDQLLGDAGLPADLSQNASATGLENTSAEQPNVVVSGWQVYNNKGWVVEAYEPYFDKGFAYTRPQEPGKGVKTRQFYDPRGQVIRSVMPDGSEQRVIFGTPLSLDNPSVFEPSPWVSYSYDANDLAELTHYGHPHVPAQHYYTPSSAWIDALGRTVRTIDRNATPSGQEEVEMRYTYDIRGNLLLVADALKIAETPTRPYAFAHTYDLLNRPLSTTHIDAGYSMQFPDALNRPVESRDERGSLSLHAYDEGGRPVAIWARDRQTESTTLRHRLIYGDQAGLGDPSAQNLLGRLYRHYDEAGLVAIDAYDFKGNVPEKSRRMIDDAVILSVFSPPGWETIDTFVTDWEELEDTDLSSQAYVTSMEYDALNRLTRLVYPENTEEERKILLPVYNRAGALESVQVRAHAGALAETYVERIAYNARGQRILLALGNGVMTRYRYHAETFRLERVKSEKYTLSGLTYSPDAGNRINMGYEYDLSGNIVRTTDQTLDAGIPGSLPGKDTLVRDFGYDALYRLLSATGRESSASRVATPWDDDIKGGDPNATRAYTELYTYDRLGNIQSLQHASASGFTRHFSYTETSNRLVSVSVGEESYGFGYDQSGNMLSDDAGNSRYLEYNYAGKLRAFRTQAGTSEPSVFAHYLYDSGGNRVKKLVRKQGGGYKSTSYIDGLYEHSKASTFTDSIPYLRIGTWSVGGEEGEQSLHHILDGASRIATLRTGAELGDNTPAVKYNLEDHLNSSCMLLDANGTLINKEEYTPFGETSFGSYGRKRYRYNGKEKDEESGLYNYGMRYYAPWMCRFVSVDPLAGKNPDKTPYHYASNNPINRIDPSGMEDEPSNSGKGDSGNDNTAIGTFVHESGEEYSYTGEEGVSEKILKEFGWSKKIEVSGASDKDVLKSDNTRVEKTPFNPQDIIPSNERKEGFKLNSAEQALRDETIKTATEKGSELLEKKAENIQQDLRKKGVVGSSSGKNYQTTLKKDGTPREKGNQYFTTRGYNANTRTTKALKIVAKGLSEVGNYMELANMAQVMLGKAEPYTLLPLSFVNDEMFKEIDQALLNAALSQGYQKTLDYKNNNEKLMKDFSMLYMNKEDFDALMSGTITDMSQIKSLGQMSHGYAAFVHTGKSLSVLAGFKFK